MKILVIGAAGMIGRKLAARLASDGTLAGKKIEALHLVDVTTLPSRPACPGVSRSRRRICLRPEFRRGSLPAGPM